MLNDSRLDQAFQALSDTTRRGILARLAAGPRAVAEIAAPLPMSLPAVLQHLKVLETSGLIRSEKKGRVRTCHLAPHAVAAAEAWLARQRIVWEARTDRLEQHLATMEDQAK